MYSIELCPCSSAADGGGDDDVGGSTAAAAPGDSAKVKESGSHGGKTNQSNMYIQRAVEGVSCDVGRWWHACARDLGFSRRCLNSRRE